MSDLVTFIDELDTRLRDGSEGVNAQLATVESTATRVSRVYDTWNEEEFERTTDTPALLAYLRTAEPEQMTQQKIDWAITIWFFYRHGSSNPVQRKQDAAYTIHALSRCLDPKAGDFQTYYTDPLTLRPLGASVSFWGRDEDHRDELLMAAYEFGMRENLP